MKLTNLKVTVTFKAPKTESPFKRIIKAILKDIDNLNTAQDLDGIFIR